MATYGKVKPFNPKLESLRGATTLLHGRQQYYRCYEDPSHASTGYGVSKTVRARFDCAVDLLRAELFRYEVSLFREEVGPGGQSTSLEAWSINI